MMEREEIAEKVRIILEANPESLTVFYPHKNDKHPAGTRSGFSNEYVELLLQLESKIHTASSKTFFWRLLGVNFASRAPMITGRSASKILKAAGQVRKHCDCAFMAYLRTGQVKEALEGFSGRLKDYSCVSEVNSQIAFCILQVLLMESHLFSDSHLKTIESVMNRYQSCITEASSWHEKKARRMQVPAEQVPDAVSKLFGLTGTPKGQIPTDLPSTDLISRSKDVLAKLRERLRQVKFQRLKEELKGVSTEINQDKNQLISKYRDLKFSKNLIEGFEKLDTEIEQVGSKFSYSKSIGFVRNLYEESLREFASRIHDTTGEAIPNWKGKGSMGAAIDYFNSKKIKLISDNERNFLTGFSNLLSDTGSHSLTSERYEVRIARNVLVEICSYLVDKINKFLSVL